MLRRRRATTAQAQWGVIVFNPLLDIEPPIPIGP